MNKTLLSVGVVALLAVGVLGATYPKSDTPLASQGPQGVQGERGPQGPQGERGPAGSPGQSVQGLSSLLTALQGLLANLSNQQPKLGAFPGPVIDSPYLSVNGTETFFIGKNMASTSQARVATSTLCVLAAPRATSSVSARIAINRSTSTAFYVIAEKKASPFAPPAGAATSSGETVLGVWFVPANGTGNFVLAATSTPSTDAANATNQVTPFVFGPNASSTTDAGLTSQKLVVYLKNAAGAGFLNSDTDIQGPGGSCNAEFKVF